MNKLSFNILPNPESNDSEVRILIDEIDFLGFDYLGIDPPTFFDQNNFDKNGELMIGRCTCGCEGCADYPITVKVDENLIIWTSENELKLTFEKEDYLNVINLGRVDFSWEDLNRKVERLTKNILKNSITEKGYKFDWASARIKLNTITLSYSKNGQQKLFEITWDGKSEDEIETKVKLFLNNEIKKNSH
ncbi:hypothetical protein HNP99_002190 [Flavobacterium sp. 28A]|uniref:hypothetical protein n=1 Tax=Flavobacterium sp. 28A TaxID=2735895 RepID=UPI00156F294E|nr:hypothetical protein [Flavobacterium sp. 28A]NRT15830.1 hypothetical protein [Flavobacterium sp. 28A]